MNEVTNKPQGIVPEVIRSVCRAVSGKTDRQLANDFGWHYFLTRSRAKSYWLAIFR